MGSEAFLPCHGAGLSGQWVWIAGRDPRVSHYKGASGFGFWQSTRGGREAGSRGEQKNRKTDLTEKTEKKLTEKTEMINKTD